METQKQACFYKTYIGLRYVVVPNGVLGPLRPVQHTNTLDGISLVPEAIHEARALEERCCVSSKRPSRVRDGDEGVAGRSGRKKISPTRTH